MRKKLYVGALMAALALPVTVATPALADSPYVYHRGGVAWTTNADTHVNVNDADCDGDVVYVKWYINGLHAGNLRDGNGCDPGHSHRDAGGVVSHLQVCELPDEGSQTCGLLVPV